MPDFMSKILTPTGRAVLGFVQLVAYIGMGLLMLYHFVIEHDAVAATPARVAVTSALQQQPGSKRIEKKVDLAVDAINDLRQDINTVMDYLHVPQTQRASTRHALPASAAADE